MAAAINDQLSLFYRRRPVEAKNYQKTAKKEYHKPEIIHELALETRAGSVIIPGAPSTNPNPLDDLNIEP